MISVCAAGDFRKYRESAEFDFLKKTKHKKICHKQKLKCLMFFKSARRICNHLNFKSIKTALKTLNFFNNCFFLYFSTQEL